MKVPKSPGSGKTYDTVIHCKSEAQARFILDKVNARMRQCKLELHPEKTKIVYCKDKDRTGNYGTTKFDFLGYTFLGITIKDKLGRIQTNFLPSVSKKACQSLKDKIKGNTQKKWVEDRNDSRTDQLCCPRLDELFWPIQQVSHAQNISRSSTASDKMGDVQIQAFQRALKKG